MYYGPTEIFILPLEMTNGIKQLNVAVKSLSVRADSQVQNTLIKNPDLENSLTWEYLPKFPRDA